MKRETEELSADMMLYWETNGDAVLIGANGDRRGTLNEMLDALVSGETGDVEHPECVGREFGAVLVRGGTASAWIGEHRIASGFVGGVVERVRQMVE